MEKKIQELSMSTKEIVEMYRGCKNPNHQITIIADMCMTDRKTIREILIQEGCDVPEDKRFKNNNAPDSKEIIKINDQIKSNVQQSVQSTQIQDSSRFIPDSIRRILEEKRKYLINQKNQIQSDIDEINKFLGGK